MNYCDADVPYTRITEHKHFAPWESHDAHRDRPPSTAAPREPDDIPYYPVRLVNDKAQLLDATSALAQRTSRDVTFLGRLGTYRYLDMDVTIKEALEAAASTVASIKARTPIRAFFVDP